MRTSRFVFVAVVWAAGCGAPVGVTDAGVVAGGMPGGGSAGGASGGGTPTSGGVGGGNVSGGGTATGGGAAGGTVTAGGVATGGGAVTGGGMAGGDVAGGGAVTGGGLAGGTVTAGGDGGGMSTAGGAAGGGSMSAGGTTAGGAGGGSAGGSTNQPPVVNGIVLARGSTPLSQPVFAGQLVTLIPDVLDPEGQPLTYSWSVASGPDGGTFSSETAESPTWFSGDVVTLAAPLPEWTLRLEVSDGVNPPTRFDQTVQVRAPRFSNILADSVIGSTAAGGCSNGFCHGNATTPTGGFAINRFNPNATYMAMTATHNKGATCSIATRRIVAFNTNTSLLYRKLLGGIPIACGARMPLNQPPVSPNELVTIRSWINAGALQN